MGRLAKIAEVLDGLSARESVGRRMDSAKASWFEVIHYIGLLS